jgi:hypothetical protein
MSEPTNTVKHTPGPWNLVWWGNETYPYPLSILADNDGAWIARGGTISNPADGRLIAAAPEMMAALKDARAIIYEDREAIFDAVTVAGIDSTMDEIDRPHVERLDAVLSVIDAAISKATGSPAPQEKGRAE